MHVGSERATGNDNSHHMSVCKTAGKTSRHCDGMAESGQSKETCLWKGQGKPVVLTQWVNINDYIASKRKEQLTMA